MMQDIKQREEKIKQKRMKTDFRTFVKEIGSRFSVVLHKQDGLISRYPDTGRVKKIVPFNNFHDNEDQRIKDGLDYDESKSFFQQWADLFKNTQHANLFNYYGVENCDFANEVLRSKNVYLSHTIIGDCENILYTANSKENCTNVLNSMMVRNNSENIYFGSGIINSSKVFYSRYIRDSFDIWMSSNLIACQHCVFCDNLINQKYCIYNKQYSEQEYKLKKEDILRKKEVFLEYYKNMTDIGKNTGSTNATGVFVQESENVENGYYCYQLKNARNSLIWGGKGVNQNVVDVLSGGTKDNNNIYAVCGAGAGSENVYCSCHIVSSNIYYSYFLQSCSYCIGCFGLTNRKYCILNKQYTKEERFELANKIFAQMDKEGTLGEFFPPSMNPYYFNDTLAYLIDDTFTKEEVISEGYLRRDDSIKVDIPEGQETVKTTELNQYQGFDSEGKRKINPEILKKVIIDEKGNFYRIVKMEYDFLVKHGLPLPEIHWLDRIKLGFKFR